MRTLHAMLTAYMARKWRIALLTMLSYAALC